MVVIDQLTLEAIVIGGAVMGGIGRMMFPYLRKMAAAEQAGQPIDFQHKFTFTTVFSVIVASIVGMTLFPQLVTSFTLNASVTTIFFSSFLTAWGSTDLFNNVMATGSTNPPATSIKKPTA